PEFGVVCRPRTIPGTPSARRISARFPPSAPKRRRPAHPISQRAVAGRPQIMKSSNARERSRRSNWIHRREWRRPGGATEKATADEKDVAESAHGRRSTPQLAIADQQLQPKVAIYANWNCDVFKLGSYFAPLILSLTQLSTSLARLSSERPLAPCSVSIQQSSEARCRVRGCGAASVAGCVGGCGFVSVAGAPVGYPIRISLTV